MIKKERNVLRILGVLLICATVLLTLSGCDWLFGPKTEVDFGNLTNGTVYNVGDSFTSGDVTMTVLPFQWSNSTVTSAGMATIDDQLSAGGTGLDINLNNVCLGFRFSHDISKISLNFGEYGGNINVETNDDLVNQDNFYGMILPNIGLTIPNLGGDLGSITADGDMALSPFTLATGSGNFHFIIGGQELWIDDIIGKE